MFKNDLWHKSLILWTVPKCVPETANRQVETEGRDDCIAEFRTGGQ